MADQDDHAPRPMKRKTRDNDEQGESSRRKRRADFRDAEDLANVNYCFEHGLRKVKPYYFKYQAYAKGRWLGRKIIDVFTSEFRDRNEAYYNRAIEKGLVTINGEKVDVDTVVRNGDVIGHQIHRHEPPATDKPIRIVYEQKDLYVIDKPGGIPVHPAGRYRHNTVLHVLRKQYNIETLYPANRLDRLTSGLMLIALNSQRAKELEQEMSQGKIQKEYVCRVEGEFPEEQVVCEAPIKVISFKLSLNYVHEDGKPCKTIFERIGYDGKTSILRCKPLTGRTHQIRVHLRYLGYPIANDPLYGNQTSWAPMLQTSHTMTEPEAQTVQQKLLQNCAEEELELPTDDGRCSDCGVALMADPKPDELYIWLHAWRYSGNGWSYETELPEWAKVAEINHEQDTVQTST
ncbi:hypothetical protein DFQ28_001831 [Apophysomyces sp. BC1034]|nr:hypothetical protein DFQ30_009574 [Apophysomyces sp. BC1015]KAG0183281.1 hypothetical protein DFQ29_007827 [Apophysomyces sp. BC1021]KAG0194030.1 hypothetical protein DFQ28_001831 [Apophysomyces sp. BC1034]